MTPVRSRIALPLLAGLLLAACGSMQATDGLAGGGPAGAAPARVTRTVSYPQREALPPGATLKVQLVDVSRAGAPAIVLGEQIIAAGGRQPPFAFAIAYEPAMIDPRYTYAVQARIEDSGKLLFINDNRYAVITRGAPSQVEMVLRAVGAAGPK